MDEVTWLDVVYAYLGMTYFAYVHAYNLIELALWLLVGCGAMGFLQWVS